MRHEPLKDRARGRWPGILTALGVPAKALRNRHGPCPVCGGKDRFRFDDKGGAGNLDLLADAAPATASSS